MISETDFIDLILKHDFSNLLAQKKEEVLIIVK